MYSTSFDKTQKRDYNQRGRHPDDRASIDEFVRTSRTNREITGSRSITLSCRQKSSFHSGILDLRSFSGRFRYVMHKSASFADQPNRRASSFIVTLTENVIAKLLRGTSRSCDNKIVVEIVTRSKITRKQTFCVSRVFLAVL